MSLQIYKNNLLQNNQMNQHFLYFVWPDASTSKHLPKKQKFRWHDYILVKTTLKLMQRYCWKVFFVHKYFYCSLKIVKFDPFGHYMHFLVIWLHNFQIIARIFWIKSVIFWRHKRCSPLFFCPPPQLVYT